MWPFEKREIQPEAKTRFSLGQSKIVALPDMVDKTNLDVRYELIPPFVNVHIFWDRNTSELVYNVEEPILDLKEKTLLNLIEDGLKELINISFIGIKDTATVIEYLEKNIRVLLNELRIKITEDSFVKILYYVYRDFVGLNEIEPLMRDFFIEDIQCNGVNTPLYLVHRKYRNLRTNIVFNDLRKLTSFVEKLAQKCGQYVSYANPLLDAALPDGSRANATYTQDVTSRGPTFTIRKFTKIPWTPTQLIQMGTISPEILAYMWMVIESQGNFLVIGGTGSGKTSLINALAFFIPYASRVVSIEDSVTGDSELLYKYAGQIKRAPIKEVTRKVKKGKLNLDKLEVLTLDDNFKIKWIKPGKFIEHATTKAIYEVTTSTGRVVKVTKDHSLFTLSGDGRLEEIKPEQLEENSSRIAVPRVLPIEGAGVKEINLMDHLNTFEKDFLVGEPVRKLFQKYNRKDFNVSKSKYRWWKSKNLIQIKYFNRIGYKFTKQELKELYVKSKNTTKLPAVFELNEDFLKLIGLWIGDGSYDEYNKNMVIISTNEKETVELYHRIGDKLGIKVNRMSDDWSWRFNSTILYKFMKHVLGLNGHAKQKRIPDFVYNLTNDQLKNVISGYFTADGAVKNYEVSCSSQSGDLLHSIQTLLLRFGIISRISRALRTDECKDLNISSYDNVNRFKEIKFIDSRRNSKLDSICLNKPHHATSDTIPINLFWVNGILKYKDVFRGSFTGDSLPGRDHMSSFVEGCPEMPAESLNLLRKISQSEILWDKVVKIEKLPIKRRCVYDISVPGTEKFLAQNVLLHNTKELMLLHENWLPAIARAGVGMANLVGQKQGEVSLFDLLKESFRQRPDYVIVGEIRGQEAFVLFQGAASGHSTMSTMHAENVDTVVRRLETPPISLSPALVEILDVVLVMTQAKLGDKYVRRVREVSEVLRVTHDRANTHQVFAWDPIKDSYSGRGSQRIFDRISKLRGWTKEQIEKEFKLRTRLLQEMTRRGIFDFKQVQDIISAYYKQPLGVLRYFGIV